MATLPTSLRLEIVTPDRQVLAGEAEEVSIPGSEGYLGILPGHLPLITMLGTGVLSFRLGAKKQNFAVSGGFAEVLPERVIVMADTLERPEEIDVNRARQAKERAEKMLSSKDPMDVPAVMDALMRASSRISVAEMK